MQVRAAWLSAVPSNTMNRRFVIIVVAAIVVGCVATPPRFTWSGNGAGTSGDFTLPAGTYGVAWAADDEPDRTAGCRFDLVLDRERDVLEAEQPLGRAIPKLAHQSIGEGATIRGHTTLHLAAQTYRFHVEGNCAWRVTVIDG